MCLLGTIIIFLAISLDYSICRGKRWQGSIFQLLDNISADLIQKLSVQNTYNVRRGDNQSNLNVQVKLDSIVDPHAVQEFWVILIVSVYSLPPGLGKIKIG